MQGYEKYKDSGVAWIGEIPENWEVKRLKYISDANPSNIDKKSKTNEDTVYLCNYVDVYKNEFIDDSLEFMKATATEQQIEKFILEKGDVLVTKDSESPDDIANPTLVIQDFDNVVCGYHLTHIKPKNIYGAYLFRFFQTKYLESYFEVSANGVTRYGLSVDKFNSALILLPPLEEQKKIATYLTKKTKEIDTLIDQKEQLLKLYEEEKRAIINRAVTKGIDADVVMKDSGIIKIKEIPKSWKITKFRFLFDLSKGLNITKKNLKSNGIPCVNYGEIHSKYGFEIIPERDNLKCVEKDYLETASKALLQRGDFVFADTSEDIEGSGNFTHLHSDKNIFAGYHTVIARLKLDVNYRYIAYFIESISFRNQIQEQVKGVKVYSITNTILKDIFILLPLKEEQNKIVEFIENELSRINRKIQKTKDIITLQKEYRTALISEVVTGKIKVTEEEV